MKILITGSAGHLGEALMRTFEHSDHESLGIDIQPSPYTTFQGSITDRSLVRHCLKGVDVVMHTATLHKPHIATHSRQDFVATNITGTLNLLEAAVEAGVGTFIYTSTTSVFGHALTPPGDAPAGWITEQTVPIPKNIYGVTKLAAENLCALIHASHGLRCIVLRTSRFFPEDDDNRMARSRYDNANLKVNELLYRRADIDDVVSAHLSAMQAAARIGFGRYVISATTPFRRSDLAELRRDAPAVVVRYAPGYAAEYHRRAWSMLPSIDRVYVNELARTELRWHPRYGFDRAIKALAMGAEFRSPLALAVGTKGYHAEIFADGPYPV